MTSIAASMRNRVSSVLVTLFVFLVAGGWLQHLYTCFNTGRWGFLIAGALFFPIAVIHGWGLWLGVW